MKALTFMLFFVLVSGAAVGQRGSAVFPRGVVVDLSYSFDSESVYWPTAEPFHLKKDFEGVTEKGFYYSAYKYSAAEHGGTHLDAPVHFSQGRHTVDQIPLEQLMGAGIVVDVTKQCENNSDYRVTTKDFLAWEQKHGRIPTGSILLLRTGFGRFYPDRKKYLGTEERGAGAVARGAMTDLPIISLTSACPIKPIPIPPHSRGKFGAHRRCAFTSRCNSLSK
jgi:hypothetical protein